MTLIPPPQLKDEVLAEIALNEADIIRLSGNRDAFPGATEKVDDQLAACLRWREKLARDLEAAL